MMGDALFRLGTILRALFHAGIADLEKRNPGALLELEKENLRRRVMDYDNGLAAHAGLTERLMSRVRLLSRGDSEIAARITAQLEAGERDAASRSALALKDLRNELGDAREQLADAETTYHSLRRGRETAVSDARARIETMRQAIQSLKMERAAAEILALSGGVSFDRSSATFDRLREMVEEERLKARGRLRVARDGMDDGADVASDAERAVLAQRALSEFLATKATSTGVADPILIPPDPNVGPRAGARRR